jgi:hypothetical protein
MARYFTQTLFSLSMLVMVSGCSTLSTQAPEKHHHENMACADDSVLIADLTKPDFLKHSSEITVP